MKTAPLITLDLLVENIKNQHEFDLLLYSKELYLILAAKGMISVVSAANRAEMWRINQEPEADQQNWDLTSHIEKGELTGVNFKRLEHNPQCQWRHALL